MYVLGIHGGHTSSACILKDGKIEAYVSEERFNRIKNFTGIPTASIEYVLKYCKISSEELDLVVVPSNILGFVPDVILK